MGMESVSVTAFRGPNVSRNLFCFHQVGFKGFHVPKEKQSTVMPFLHDGTEYSLAHGSVVIAAIISCTNNCNPSVMLTAGDDLIC